MLTLAQIKYFKSLHQKKIRRQENKILLEGFRLIHQALSANASIEEVWLTKKSADTEKGKSLLQSIKSNSIPFSIIPEKIIRQMSDSLNDQGVLALTAIPNYTNNKMDFSPALYLDGISDPGNMGTIFRTAAWFGLTSIYLSPDSVDPFNSKVVRSAMGAHFYFTQLDSQLGEEILNKYISSGSEIIAANLDGELLKNYEASQANKWILVLGNEAHGIRKSTQKLITSSISIPGVPGMESLNVSVAGGIILQYLTV